MGNLGGYLADKGRALADRLERITRGEVTAQRLRARVTAEGQSGVRRIRIRDHQLLNDSPADLAGFDFGPTSHELQLGVLGSCLTHIVQIQAAERKLPIEEVEVEISATLDPRAGRPGFEQVPAAPHAIACKVYISSPAPKEQVQALFDAVERSCPILNLLRQPQQVKAELVLRLPAWAAHEAYALAV